MRTSGLSVCGLATDVEHGAHALCAEGTECLYGYIKFSQLHAQSVRKLDVLSRLVHPHLLSMITLHSPYTADASEELMVIVPLPSIVLAMNVLKFWSARDKREMLYKVGHALRFLHHCGYAHNDLSMDNIKLVSLSNKHPVLDGFDKLSSGDTAADVAAFCALCARVTGVTVEADNMDTIMNMLVPKGLDIAAHTQSYVAPQATVADEARFLQLHREGLKAVLVWSRRLADKFPSMTSQVLFEAIALYNHTRAYLPGTLTDMCHSLAVACIILAGQVYCDDDYDYTIMNIAGLYNAEAVKSVHKMQLFVLTMLNGMVRTDRYYPAACNLGELAILLYEVIMAKDNCHYYTVQPRAYLDQARTIDAGLAKMGVDAPLEHYVVLQ